MFIPGENISFEYRMPFGNDYINTVLVSYYQNDRLVLVHNTYKSEISNTEKGSTFTHVLSQEESLLFDDNSDFTVQLNVIFESGTRATSKEMHGRNIRQHIREKVVKSNG